MKRPKSYEELADLLNQGGRQLLFFTADWCPDCQYVYPFMPAIEQDYPDYDFIRIGRDDFMPLAEEWDVFGIPSFLVLEKGQELARFVSKNRKTEAEIRAFLSQCRKEMD